MANKKSWEQIEIENQEKELDDDFVEYMEWAEKANNITNQMIDDGVLV